MVTSQHSNVFWGISGRRKGITSRHFPLQELESTEEKLENLNSESVPVPFGGRKLSQMIWVG